jgi:hypothetical protein
MLGPFSVKYTGGFRIIVAFTLFYLQSDNVAVTNGSHFLFLLWVSLSFVFCLL